MSARSALLAAVVLCGTVEAWATDQDEFLSVLKKFGVTEFPAPSKKACLCVGGPYTLGVGRLVMFQVGSGFYIYECAVPIFNQQGEETGPGLCLAAGGSSVVLLSK